MEPINEQQPAAQSGQPVQQQSQPATPEEQDAYNKVVLAGMRVLYQEGTHESIMQILQAGEDPAEMIAKAVAMIVSELDKKSGGKIPKQVVIQASLELMVLVAELAEKAGLFQPDDAILKKAVERLGFYIGKAYQGQQQPAPPQQPTEQAPQTGMINSAMQGGAQ